MAIICRYANKKSGYPSRATTLMMKNQKVMSIFIRGEEPFFDQLIYGLVYLQL